MNIYSQISFKQLLILSALLFGVGKINCGQSELNVKILEKSILEQSMMDLKSLMQEKIDNYKNENVELNHENQRLVELKQFCKNLIHPIVVLSNQLTYLPRQKETTKEEIKNTQRLYNKYSTIDDLGECAKEVEKEIQQNHRIIEQNQAVIIEYEKNIENYKIEIQNLDRQIDKLIEQIKQIKHDIKQRKRADKPDRAQKPELVQTMVVLRDISKDQYEHDMTRIIGSVLAKFAIVLVAELSKDKGKKSIKNIHTASTHLKKQYAAIAKSRPYPDDKYNKQYAKRIDDVLGIIERIIWGLEKGIINSMGHINTMLDIIQEEKKTEQEKLAIFMIKTIFEIKSNPTRDIVHILKTITKTSCFIAGMIGFIIYKAMPQESNIHFLESQLLKYFLYSNLTYAAELA